MKTLKKWMMLAVIMLTAASFVSCEETVEPDFGISIRKPNVAGTSGSQFVNVTAPSDWTLTIKTDEEEVDGEFWAWFKSFGTEEETLTIKGNDKSGPIVLYWAENLGESQRVCTIVLTCGELETSCTLTQAFTTPSGTENTAKDLVSENKNRKWMELPQMAEDDGYYFFSHPMTIGSFTSRNFSYYWDVDNLVATWVAYPLNAWSIGTGGRSEAWGLDPKLPREYQPVLKSGFKGGYDRGHQCPSADRLSPDANRQTFYGTNMTPQKGALNQKSWATLESMVRSWARQFDTLYVVTGCDVQGSRSVAYDNDGKRVTVPEGYFKALLGYSKRGTTGNTARTGGYTGVAFYMAHEAYTDSRDALIGLEISIDRLEEMMGINFFPMLDEVCSSADVIESTVDDFWKK